MSEKCGHGGTHYYYEVEVPDKGWVSIDICSRCQLISTYCHHKKCTWVGEPSDDLDDEEGGERLICDLCGVDGT